MTPSCIPRTAAFAMLFLTSAGAASAADDHGHAHDAPAVSTGAAAPRFTAASDRFELVGVLNGRQLTMYLDRFADNSPVENAQLDLKIDGAEVRAQPHGEGEFEALLAKAPVPGVLSISASVLADGESSLLAGELDIHEAAHPDGAVSPPRWRRTAPWLLGALAIAGLLFLAGRLVKAARRRRIGSTA